MTNLPMTFNFDGEIVQPIIQDDGSLWFSASEVCKILDISNPRDAILKLDADERGVGKTDTNAGRREINIISESGLYTLIMRCRDAVKEGSKPHRFKKWVTKEILPSIRKTGSYGQGDVIQALSDPATLRNLLLNYNERVQVLEHKVEEDKPKVQFYEDVGQAINSFDVGAAAKILGTGRQRFFDLLRDEGYIIRSDEPYQRYIDQGLFEVITRTYYDRNNGKPILYKRIYITGKGLRYFHKKYFSDIELVIPETLDNLQPLVYSAMEGTSNMRL